MNQTKKLWPYAANLILIWATVLTYFYLPFYTKFLRHETNITLLTLAIFYTILGFIHWNFFSKKSESKGTIVFKMFSSLLKQLKKFIKSPSIKLLPKWTKKEKINFLFILVKIFFLPLMLNFMFSNFFHIKNQILSLPNFYSFFSINSFNLISFPILISLIFLIDTAYFAFGYAFESESLKNKIRSTEPTILGWAVALICYPPFNSMLNGKVSWFPNIYLNLETPLESFFLKSSVALLLLIYLSATLALGTKCSNLTNRGIVTKGPYAIIRHPAYISKNLSWWIVLLPVLTWKAALSMGIWSFIYHLRTITEENHLKQDPDYIKYCKKVKYRYIPKVY